MTRQEAANDLGAIASLKEQELSNWLNERQKLAGELSKKQFFVRQVSVLADNPENKQIKNALSEFLALPVKVLDFEQVLVIGQKGSVLAHSGEGMVQFDPLLHNVIHNILQAGHITHTDFYYSELDQSIHYDILAPIMDDNEMIAVAIFRMDPDHYLFPLIQSWPTPSLTGETLIVRKIEDSVLFLNELRHQPNPRLDFKIAMTEEDVPAIIAVNGSTGVVQGTDYRGHKVLADMRPVEGTPWFLITKIDTKEIFKPLRYKSVLLILLTLSIVFLIVVILTLFFRIKQKNTYKSLWLSQEEFKTTLYSIGDAVITTDSKTRIVHMNPIAESLTGWREKDAEGKNLGEVFHIINEETREIVPDPTKKVFKDGVIVGLANHTLLVSKNGKEIPIADSAAPIIGKENQILGAVLVFRNQTVERLAKKSLIQSEKRFRNVLETIELIGVQLDQECRIIFANDYLLKLTGWSREEILNKNWIELFIPEDLRSAITEVFNKTVNDQQFPSSHTNQIITKNGELRTIKWSNTLNKQDDLSNPIITSIGEDITEQLKTEEDLIVAREQAVESDRLKSSFLANMSHEIRTPMNGIMGFSELLEEPDLTGEEKTRYIHLIQQSGNRMLNIINDLIDISKIEAGQISLHIEEIKLTDIFAHLKEVFQHEASRKNLSLIFETETKELDCAIETDKTKFVQILSNLINNAIKFTKKGHITIGCKFNQEMIECYVKDSGIGINPDYFEHVFKRFRQEQQETNREYEGAGLGLSISKAFVEYMGGKIWFESTVGKGSTFYFTLPRK